MNAMKHKNGREVAGREADTSQDILVKLHMYKLHSLVDVLVNYRGSEMPAQERINCRQDVLPELIMALWEATRGINQNKRR